MPSLTEHMRRPVGHGRLTFHPECPVCCEERLAGKLPSDAVVGRRTPALLAAGLLALSTAAPATTFASEPDQEQEEAPAPEGGPGDDGQEGAAAPEKRAADEYEAEGEVPELAPEPEQQVPEHPVIPGQPPEGDKAPNPEADAPPGDGEPAPEPAGEAAPKPDAEPAPVPDPQAGTPVPEAHAPGNVAPSGSTAATGPIGKVSSGPPLQSLVKRKSADRRAARTSNPAPVQTAASVPASTTVLVPTASTSSSNGNQAATSGARTRTTGARSRAARPGDRTHVVAPGESLWSIAADHLGGDASVAATAREVNRLWELNARRIGTGDPSLIHAGTTLML